jgi:tripartite-type tricarboxylate transporter receptor subunit TctC
MINRRRLLTTSAASVFAPALIGRAQAQGFPSRFVRLIVPLAPGGPTDVAARVMADPLSRMWGQQVVVENKPGGGTNIAAELVAKSAPDGHTILYATSSLAVAPSLYRTLGYDPVADLAPVANLFTFPYYMFVPNTSPAKTVAELIAHAKKNPGKLTMASPGTGSAPHLAIELFKTMAGIEMTHVPYRGAGPVLNDLIPGRVDVYIASGSLLENVRAGQIRGLGTTGLKPDPAAPDLPPIADTVPGYEVMSWQAMFVAAKTPPAVIKSINTAALSALADPNVKSKAELIGYVPAGSSADELAKMLKVEIAKWAGVIKAAGLKVN